MLRLEERHVRLGSAAVGKEAAIRLVGSVMVEAGLIEPGYVDSMLAREEVASTFLGNGIAIPHGLPAARDLVRATGIVVVQFPAGVDWGDQHRTTVAVGIAARSDEHLSVLAKLTGLLGDAATAEKLARTTDVRELLAALNGEPAAAEPAPVRWTGGTSILVESPRPHGLHARPATALINVAKRFAAEIQVRHGEKAANGKSLVSMLRLGASGGVPLEISARGADATSALEAISALFATGIDEEPAPAPGTPRPVLSVDYEGHVFAGISASPGIVEGPAWSFQRERLVVAETAADPVVQRHRLDQALAGAAADLRHVFEEFSRKAGAPRAAIFRAHLELLEDPDLVAAAYALVATGKSAGWAWRNVYEDRAAGLAELSDATLAARAADLRDVGRRVLHLLADAVESAASLPDHPVLLLAEDLEPSDTARLDPEQVLGLCTAGGGPTSHTAIIARSLDIPALVAAGPGVLDIADGEIMILDGDAGVLVAHPTARDLARAAERRSQAMERHEAERLERFKPAVTLDGRRVEVVANIGGPSEAPQAIDAGGEGVGLVRTEFLFLKRDTPPGEDEQFEAYRKVVREMDGLPVTIRTYDLGADKKINGIESPGTNPALGLRAIRLSLTEPQMFLVQLRAMLRASHYGKLKILIPMVMSASEINQTLNYIAQARQSLEDKYIPYDRGVEVGGMIEIPAAALALNTFIRKLDFLSIGTNDLIQYTLAIDRTDDTVSHLYDPLHPAVLNLVAHVIKTVNKAGKPVALCGEMAGDVRLTRLLLGFGLRQFSMHPACLLEVKQQVLKSNLREITPLAGKMLRAGEPDKLQAMLAKLNA